MLSHPLFAALGKYPRRSGQGRGGFSAIETLIAIAILAIITTAVSGALSAGRQQSRNAQDTLRASMLARALMEEILRLPFYDPQGYNQLGPGPGENSRLQYDNITDYAGNPGYSDGPTNICYISINQTTYARTTTLYPTEYQGFTRSVTMTTQTSSPPGWGRSIDGLLVTVTVSRDGRPLATLKRYISPN